MRNILVCVLCVLFLSGCAFKPTGMNAQRSALRGVGDSAVTIALDSMRSDADVSAVSAQVSSIAAAVQSFLKGGQVSSMTIPELTDQLKKIIPADYQFLLSIMVAQVQGVAVDTSVIGENNVERINSVCVGLINGCALYDIKYRPIPLSSADVVAPADKSKAMIKPRAHPVAVENFGKKLKKAYRVR